ncbi:MAG: hypothetical protein KDA59_21490, partial [Planctomycetales bacterium]|nr:hypothetical protein [Planctomycetales bacterium]
SADSCGGDPIGCELSGCEFSGCEPLNCEAGGAAQTSAQFAKPGRQFAGEQTRLRRPRPNSPATGKSATAGNPPTIAEPVPATAKSRAHHATAGI